MKFTKTIAEALANKVYQNLSEERRKAIEAFTLPEEKSIELKAMLAERLRLTERMKELDNSLSKIAMVTNRAYNDTLETLYVKYVHKIGEQRLKPLPSRETLTDDFLIESLDAANADELIAKVIAKYVA